jgi:hypothetical protein
LQSLRRQNALRAKRKRVAGENGIRIANSAGRSRTRTSPHLARKPLRCLTRRKTAPRRGEVWLVDLVQGGVTLGNHEKRTKLWGDTFSRSRSGAIGGPPIRNRMRLDCGTQYC